MDKRLIFAPVLNGFETEEMRLYCEDMIDQMPDYIFTIPSSTSYKYHNATQCQPGGQIYHVLMVCTIMNYILNLEYIKKKWPEPKRRDCMRIAACLHDAVKCGWSGGTFTVHDHPMLASEWIQNTEVEHDIKPGLKKYIGRLVESHSGQWTSSNKSKVVLPEPENDEQFLVHLCDYLGSRSNLDMIYTDEEKDAISGAQEPVEPSEVVMRFGKYKGEKLGEIPVDYLLWCKNNLTLNEPIKSAIEVLIKQ